MTRPQRHLYLPALAPLLFFAVALSPVDWLGCRNRGLLAVIIALTAALLGVGCAVLALRSRLRDSTDDGRWWALSALLLALPAVGVLLLA